MRKYKLISALAEETAKDVVRNEEMHCWVNKGAKGIELIDELPDIFGQGVEIDNSEAVSSSAGRSAFSDHSRPDRDRGRGNPRKYRNRWYGSFAYSGNRNS